MRKLLPLLILCYSCQVSPVDIEELKAIGQSIESSIEDRDVEQLNHWISYSSFLEKMAEGHSLTEREREVFEIELRETSVFANKIFNITNQYERIDLVKTYIEEGRSYSLFRLSGATKLLNYLRLEQLKIGGDIKIVDAYLFSSGHWFSEEIKTLGVIKDERQADSFDRGYALHSIQKAIDKNEMVKAVALLNTLPDQYKNERVFRTIALLIDSKREDVDYEEKIRNYNTLFADRVDYSLYISMIRYLRLQDCQRMEKAIMDLEHIVGQDSILLKLIDQCGRKG